MSKKIIFFITILAGLLMFITPAKTSAITITPDPIFNIGNLIPGQYFNKEVLIKNNSGTDYNKIILSGREISDQIDLSSVMNLKVEEMDSVKLSSFLKGGEIIFEGGIKNGEARKFNFLIEFVKEAEEKYQGAILVFDFLFSFEGEETRKTVVVSGTGGGGQSRRLEISNEEAVDIEETSSVIKWTTSYPATSQVLYSDKCGHALDLTKPNYGYAYATEEIPMGVVSHSIFLSGLEPGRIYCFRVVSRYPLTISREHYFITKEVEDEPLVPIPPYLPPPAFSPLEDIEEIGEKEAPVRPGVIYIEDISPAEYHEEPQRDRPLFLAAIGAMWNFTSYIFPIILSLFLIWLIMFYRRREQKKNPTKLFKIPKGNA